jgi:Glycosyltransferase family 36
VITDPFTSVKWINYIGTRQFGGFVDHTGGALICKDDPTFNRITKYIQQMPASDFKGETLYVRIYSGDGCHRIFSQVMEYGKVYIVKRYACHTILLSRDASVLLVEYKDTDSHNSGFPPYARTTSSDSNDCPSHANPIVFHLPV